MPDFNSLLNDVDTTVGSGLFDNLNIAEPVPEMLPHRGKPYELDAQTTQNPLFRFVNQVVEPTNSITDTEIMMRAEQEVDWLLFLMEMFGGVFRGVFGELIISDDDLAKLRLFQAGSEFSPEEMADIIRRDEIKTKFEHAKPTDRSKQREFLQKVVAEEMKKKRAAGTLKFPSSTDFMWKMFLTETITATCGDYSVMKTVGKNAVLKVKKLF